MAKTKKKPVAPRAVHRRIRIQQAIFTALAVLVIASFLLSVIAR